ncbi:MAG: endo alpha-1,4 polygalactosaminidase [Chloroflexota bacterium]
MDEGQGRRRLARRALARHPPHWTSSSRCCATASTTGARPRLRRRRVRLGRRLRRGHGLPLTRADQLRYDRWRGARRRARGSGRAEERAGPCADARRGWDLSVVEQCFQYRECGQYLPFVTAGKPVLDVEYSLGRAAFCDRAATLGITAIREAPRARSWRAAC